MSGLYEQMLALPTLPEELERLRQAMLTERELREKFYADISPEDKWEFINGEVVMHSPAMERHLAATGRIAKLLDTHAVIMGLGVVRSEKALCVFPRNDYEPDVVFFGKEKAAGIEPKTLKFPVPDLVVEVLSDSTAGRDRGVKFEDYAAHKVREYWIVDPEKETVEVYRLTGGTYYPEVKAVAEGEVESTVVAGFRIPVRALFDDGENLAALRVLMG